VLSADYNWTPGNLRQREWKSMSIFGDGRGRKPEEVVPIQRDPVLKRSGRENVSRGGQRHGLIRARNLDEEWARDNSGVRSAAENGSGSSSCSIQAERSRKI
jgi:hypothetical protein